MPDLDWSEMEGLFCQQAPMALTSQNGVLNFKLGQDSNECDKKRKEPTEVRETDISNINFMELYFLRFYF